MNEWENSDLVELPSKLRRIPYKRCYCGGTGIYIRPDGARLTRGMLQTCDRCAVFVDDEQAAEWLLRNIEKLRRR